MIFNTTYIRIMDYWFYCIAKLDAMPAYVYVYSKYVSIWIIIIVFWMHIFRPIPILRKICFDVGHALEKKNLENNH